MRAQLILLSCIFALACGAPVEQSGVDISPVSDKEQVPAVRESVSEVAGNIAPVSEPETSVAQSDPLIEEDPAEGDELVDDNEFLFGEEVKASANNDAMKERIAKAYRDYDDSDSSSEAEYDDENEYFEEEYDDEPTPNAGKRWKNKYGSITKAKIKPIPSFGQAGYEDDEAEDLGLYGFNKSFEKLDDEKIDGSDSEESDEYYSDEAQDDEAASSSSSSESEESVEEERDDLPGPFEDEGSSEVKVFDHLSAMQHISPAYQQVETKASAEQPLAVAVVQKEEPVPEVVPIVVEEQANAPMPVVVEAVETKPEVVVEEQSEKEEESNKAKTGRSSEEDDDDDDEDEEDDEAYSDEGSDESDEDYYDDEEDDDDDDAQDDDENDDEEEYSSSEEERSDLDIKPSKSKSKKRVTRDSSDVLYYYPYPAAE